MTEVLIHRQLHGYRGGHQLLDSSLRLNADDQDLIDHLSDISGPIRPGERFPSYVTVYPLPSRKYFAVGMTEQDIDAPRAGCVMTNTILAPMQFWEKKTVPIALFEMLKAPTGMRPSVLFDGAPDPLPPVAAERALTEIARATFLNEPRAVVVFGAAEPELIIFRLLTAFSPKQRCRFSACSFALAPRTLIGKPFDLVFSPESVRSRFADWNGSWIDAGVSPNDVDDRPVSVLVDRVFYGSEPHLLDRETTGAIVSDDDELDARTLRIGLLWEELIERARTVPTAVFGLIDVAKTRGNTRAWRVVGAFAGRSLVAVASAEAPSVAWRFLWDLSSRLDDGPVKGLADVEIGTASDILTCRDSVAALSFLRNEMARKCSGMTRTDRLLNAVANSLSKEDADELTSAVSAMAPTAVARIVLLNDELMTAMFSARDANSITTMVDKVTEGLKSLDRAEYGSRSFHLLALVRGESDKELVRQIILGASTLEMVNAVNVVWGERRIRSRGMGDVLCAGAIAAGGRFEVRSEFVRSACDSQTDWCVDQLLRADADDIRWILEFPMAGWRRAALLSRLVERSRTRDLRLVFSQDELASRSLEVLSVDVRNYAKTVARVFRVSGVCDREGLLIAIEAHGFLERDKQRKIARSLVNRAFASKDLGPALGPEAVLLYLIGDLDLEEVIRDVLETRLSGCQVSRTMVVLEKASSSVPAIGGGRYLLQITRLLAGRVVYDLTPRGTRALVRLLDRGRRQEREGYIEACATILPFAMDAGRNPVSEVVKVAFPIVYAELRESRKNSWLDDFFEFLDWDRCKAARKDIVRAFMRSDWPPVDLAITALRSRELKAILARVRKEYNGLSYLGKIGKGARELEGQEAAIIQGTVESLLKKN